MVTTRSMTKPKRAPPSVVRRTQGKKRANKAMTIFVKDSNGKKISLFVKPSDDIEDVMDQIGDKEGIPTDKERLYYKETKLENGRTLSDYNIQSATVLSMRKVLRIKILGGVSDLVILEVEPTTTIKSIRAKAPKHKGLLKPFMANGILFTPLPNQEMYAEYPYRILFDGRSLSDDTIIADLDVEDEDAFEVYPEMILTHFDIKNEVE